MTSVSVRPKPLYLTIGNHMHFVDMEWLWGYGVLASSVRDLLALCRGSGAKGNVNFDAVGYERLAVEAPQALEELRAAVHAGEVEIVGATYGQPYGLFQGDESNVRQRVLGARAVRRLLGVWPRAFWEEEFDFFPQLPQILAGCGFESASLFFQWTWHTPHVPLEATPLVSWEGLDGTRLPTLARTELCLHQWPEDFEGKLESESVRELARPALVQWVELLPSPDWMCRSELLLPRLRELFGDARFELRPRTLSGLVAELAQDDAPVRRYGMDEVFHGMCLGKNGDGVPRRSRRIEALLLAAESAATLAGLLGRPYAHWDVYPTWELEEAWRELCAAQHHDNHECEGLCGHVGKASFERARSLGTAVLERTLAHLARRARTAVEERLVFNALGWERDVLLEDEDGAERVVRRVPAFGYSVVRDGAAELLAATRIEREGELVHLVRDDVRCAVDLRRGGIVSLLARDAAQVPCDPSRPLGQLELGGIPSERRPRGPELLALEHGRVRLAWRGPEGGLELEVRLAALVAGVELRYTSAAIPEPAPGYGGALYATFETALDRPRLRADHPYGWSEVRAEGSFERKYPSGEWMTSPQWFETVERPLFAASWLDLIDPVRPERALLLVHDGSSAFQATQRGARCVLTLKDPWDEDYFDAALEARFWLLPHAGRSPGAHARLARELVSPTLAARGGSAAPRRVDPGAPIPRCLGALIVEGAGVSASALLIYYSSGSAHRVQEIRLQRPRGAPARCS